MSPDFEELVGKEGSLGSGPRVGVNLPVDGLEAQGAHPHVVRAGVAEGHPVGRDLGQRALLVGKEATPLEGELMAGSEQALPVTPGSSAGPDRARKNPGSVLAPGVLDGLRRPRYGSGWLFPLYPPMLG